MPVALRSSLLVLLLALAAACGGDDDDQQADSAATQSDASDGDSGDGGDDQEQVDHGVDVDLGDATECAEDGAAPDESPDGGEGDGTDIDVGGDGVDIDTGDGDISVGDDGVDVDTPEGDISVGEGGVSIDGCFGEIDVEADDDGITISGPDGSVEISPGEAVTELGGEDTPEGIAIPLAESVLFDFDSAALRPTSGEQLSLVAGLAATYPDAHLEIGGHTDAVGDEAYNQQLSDGRAGAVRDALAVLGVAADRMTATGHGETQPLVPETTPDGADDPAGRQQNRRVEILLVGADL
ncbi:MAG: OmpA family protein [Acidimicrobiales bacterium]